MSNDVFHAHAVLTSDELVMMEAGKVCHTSILEIASTDEMLNLCVVHRIGTLWVQPGCRYARWPASNLASQAWDIRCGKVEIAGKEYYRTISANGYNRKITITWPEFAYEWDDRHLYEMPSAIDILGCLKYLAENFETPVHHNPGVMGRALMERYNDTKRRRVWIEHPDFDFDSLPTWKGEGFVYQIGVVDPDEYLDDWKRQHKCRGRKVWLHSWDKNSQYPAGGTTVRVGCGKPELVLDNKAAWDTISPRPNSTGWIVPAGYWKLNFGESPDFSHNPFFEEMNPIHPRQEWATTPILHVLLNEGIPFDIDAAYIFPEQHAVLDKFGPAFWKARQHLKDAKAFRHEPSRELAYYAAKKIGTASIGLLTSDLTIKFSPNMYRPDWWRFVIEQAKMVLYFNMKKVFDLTGEYPVMVATDAVYYLSAESDPALAFPGCFTRPDELGGWKYNFRQPIEATPEVMSLFRPRASVGKILRDLKAVERG